MSGSGAYSSESGTAAYPVFGGFGANLGLDDADAPEPVGRRKVLSEAAFLERQVRWYRSTILSAVKLPAGMSRDDVIGRILGMEHEPFRADHRRRFRGALLKELSQHNQFEGLIDKGAPNSELRTALTGELDAKGSRIAIADERLTHQREYTQDAILRGKIDVDACMTLMESLVWEDLARTVSTDIVETAKFQAAEAKGPKALNEVARDTRRSLAALRALSNGLAFGRERLVVAVESWNSSSANALFAERQWNETPPREWFDDLVDGLNQAVAGFRRSVVAGGNEAVTSMMGRLEASAGVANARRGIFLALRRPD